MQTIDNSATFRLIADAIGRYSMKNDNYRIGYADAMAGRDYKLDMPDAYFRGFDDAMKEKAFFYEHYENLTYL